MYVCQLCNHYASPSYDSVLRHIGAVHSHDAGFRIHCGIESCPKVLTNYHSFRRHLRKKHWFCLQTYDPGSDDEQLGAVSDSYADIPTVETADQGGASCSRKSATLEKRAEAMYVLKLKEKYKLAQTTVNDILDDTGEFTARVVAQLRHHLTAELSKEGFFCEESLGFAKAFQNPDLLKPFNGLHTQYLQEKYFRENLGLVVSISERSW